MHGSYDFWNVIEGFERTTGDAWSMCMVKLMQMAIASQKLQFEAKHTSALLD